MEQPQKEPAATVEAPAENKAPEKNPAPQKKSGPAKKRRKKPSPVPVSMWLLPPSRLPFSTPMDFFRWFIKGVNLWAVGAVILCVLAGWTLAKRFQEPRQLGVEQALSGGEGTAGLTYTVELTGENEVTVTGSWDAEKEQREPGPELAAALCAALSPEEIYGHSDHLYRAIASRFFEGEDFTLTIRLKRAMTKEDEEEPEPIFSVTREAGAEDWPQPDCAAAFAEKWREEYDQYWLFGQGRKEEVGPPQADPIYEEGDRPPETDQSDEEEAPPLPDLDGDLPFVDGEDGEDDQDGEDGEEPAGQEPESEPSSEEDPAGEDGEVGDEEPPAPENWLDRLVAYASRYRGLSWKEAWELFRHPEE